VSQPAPDPRRDVLSRLASETFDLVVVGGGIVGAGVLLDAASRGLSAALVEQDDIAAGTSSRSSRLIHGGLRYLEQYRFQLVREALAERARLLRLAPHLVRLEPQLFPLYGLPIVHRSYYGAGMMLYDLLGARRDGGWAGHLGTEQVLDWAPPLRRKGLRGGIVYHDGVEDDARLALAVARTALGRGAVVATRLRATGLLDRGGALDGIEVEDAESGARFGVRATRVVDATGVWMATDEHPFGRGPGVVPSRGSHLVVRRSRIPVTGGMTLRVPGRVVFLVPWHDHWLVGTTDAPYVGLPARPRADAREVDELLATVNRALDVNLSRDDVMGTYAGLRPLVAAKGSVGVTSRMSREHHIERHPGGLVRVSGGKYTTYRVMARQAVDAALGKAMARDRPSMTANLPIHGALSTTELKRLGDRLGSEDLDARAARALVARHGSEAEAVVELGRSMRLLGRLAGDGDHLEVEVVHAVRSELARSLDDVLARRMRLAVQLRDRGASLAPRVAELVGAELGWDADRQAREVAAYLDAAEREYGVPA
jgi:glycerol-3-phosphate dehydrogenase